LTIAFKRVYFYHPSDVLLTVYTLTGQEVATPMSGHQNAGHYEATWDGSGHATGLYLCRLEREGGGQWAICSDGGSGKEGRDQDGGGVE
jgi:hypothetical protein